jgi:hypothetical protein
MEVLVEEKKGKEFKTGSFVLGAILVGVGILFLVVNFVPYLSVAKLWPLFMLVPVAILMAVWLHYKERAVGVVLPVVILIFFCVYFLWLNFTSWYHVENTWPNFIIGPGLGFLGLYFAARKWEYLIPSFLLLTLAAIFYAAIIENTIIVAVLLILMGVLLILKPLIKW